MDGSTLYAANAVMRKLSDRLAHHRYGDSRGGMVPPHGVADVRQDIGDALATLDAILADSEAPTVLTLAVNPEVVR